MSTGIFHLPHLMANNAVRQAILGMARAKTEPPLKKDVPSALPITPIRQKLPDGCGGASLAMVFNALKETNTFTEEKFVMKKSAGIGISASQMVKAAKDSKLFARMVNNMTFAELKKETQAGNYIIVLVDPYDRVDDTSARRMDNKELHYMVIHGVEEDPKTGEQKVLITDPNGVPPAFKGCLDKKNGTALVPFEAFCKRQWSDVTLFKAKTDVNRFGIVFSKKPLAGNRDVPGLVAGHDVLNSLAEITGQQEALRKLLHK